MIWLKPGVFAGLLTKNPCKTSSIFVGDIQVELKKSIETEQSPHEQSPTFFWGVTGVTSFFSSLIYCGSKALRPLHDFPSFWLFPRSRPRNQNPNDLNKNRRKGLLQLRKSQLLVYKPKNYPEKCDLCFILLCNGWSSGVGGEVTVNSSCQMQDCMVTYGNIPNFMCGLISLLCYTLWGEWQCMLWAWQKQQVS